MMFSDFFVLFANTLAPVGLNNAKKGLKIEISLRNKLEIGNDND